MPWLKHRTTPDDFVRWHKMKAGVGLRFGNGLCGLDVDTLDAALADCVRSVVRAITPGAHVERVGRAPKFLILLGAPVDVRQPYKLIEFSRGPDGKPERVELLSTGKQAVVGGVHSGTRRPYEWLPSMPMIDDLVEATRSAPLLQRRV